MSLQQIIDAHADFDAAVIAAGAAIFAASQASLATHVPGVQLYLTEELYEEHLEEEHAAVIAAWQRFKDLVADQNEPSWFNRVGCYAWLNSAYEAIDAIRLYRFSGFIAPALSADEKEDWSDWRRDRVLLARGYGHDVHNYALAVNICRATVGSMEVEDEEDGTVEVTGQITNLPDDGGYVELFARNYGCDWNHLIDENNDAGYGPWEGVKYQAADPSGDQAFVFTPNLVCPAEPDGEPTAFTLPSSTWDYYAVVYDKNGWQIAESEIASGFQVGAL